MGNFMQLLIGDVACARNSSKREFFCWAPISLLFLIVEQELKGWRIAYLLWAGTV